MKKLIVLALAFLLLEQCTSIRPIERLTTILDQNELPLQTSDAALQTSIPEVTITNELIQRDNKGLFYKPFESNPYTGIYESYDNPDGVLVRETYKDGRKNGIREKFNKKGELLLRETFKEGKKDGLFQHFHEDGTLKNKAFWVNGIRYECEGNCS